MFGIFLWKLSCDQNTEDCDPYLTASLETSRVDQLLSWFVDLGALQHARMIIDQSSGCNVVLLIFMGILAAW